MTCNNTSRSIFWLLLLCRIAARSVWNNGASHLRPSQSRCDSQLPEQEARCASGTSSGGERPLDVTLSTLENALLNDEKLDFGFACAPAPEADTDANSKTAKRLYWKQQLG